MGRRSISSLSSIRKMSRCFFQILDEFRESSIYNDGPSITAGSGLRSRRGAVKPSGKRERDSGGRLRPSIDSLRVFVELGDQIKAKADQGINFASLSEAADSM